MLRWRLRSRSLLERSKKPRGNRTTPLAKQFSACWTRVSLRRWEGDGIRSRRKTCCTATHRVATSIRSQGDNMTTSKRRGPSTCPNVQMRSFDNQFITIKRTSPCPNTVLFYLEFHLDTVWTPPCPL